MRGNGCRRVNAELHSFLAPVLNGGGWSVRASATLSAEMGIRCLQKEAGWILNRYGHLQTRSLLPIGTLKPLQLKMNIFKSQVKAYDIS